VYQHADMTLASQSVLAVFARFVTSSTGSDAGVVTRNTVCSVTGAVSALSALGGTLSVGEPPLACRRPASLRIVERAMMPAFQGTHATASQAVSKPKMRWMNINQRNAIKQHVIMQDPSV